MAGTTGPSGTYGMGNSCSNPNTGNTSFFCRSGMVEPYVNASSFGYNAHGGHSTFPAVPQADPVAPRQPMFPPGTPNTWRNLWILFHYLMNFMLPFCPFCFIQLLLWRLVADCIYLLLGPSYGSSIPRPPYGNLPMQSQFPGGYAPPRPGYY